MTLPKHDDLWLPALEWLADGRARHVRDFEAPLARHFELGEDELGQMYPSGNGPVFFDRIGWALSYLKLAGLVTKPKWGVYQINDAGRRVLERPGQLPDYVRRQLAKRDQEKARQKAEASAEEASVGDGDDGTEATSERTPPEQLYASYEAIRQSVYDDILETILAKTPREFEHLVIKLLEKMGYGGQVKNAGEVTRYSNDGGIDGVIKEDVLGLGRVHIQAKRYARDKTVGRQEVQRFVGALAVAQSKKGVFITTSSYSQGAAEYADSLHGNTTLVLIDGQELAQFIYDYGLGMQVEQTIELKKLDSDFWDKMQDA